MKDSKFLELAAQLIPQDLPIDEQKIAITTIRNHNRFINQVLEQGGCLSPQGVFTRHALNSEDGYFSLPVLQLVDNSIWVAKEAVTRMIVYRTLLPKGVEDWAFYSWVEDGRMSDLAVPELLSAFEQRLKSDFQPSLELIDPTVVVRTFLTAIISRRGTYYINARNLS